MYFRTITIEYLDYGSLSPDFFEYTESTFEQAVAHFRENFRGRIIDVVCREHLPDYQPTKENSLP